MFQPPASTWGEAGPHTSDSLLARSQPPRCRAIDDAGADGGQWRDRANARLRHLADTGWEPRTDDDHLTWLMSPNVLPFPVHIVSAGNIRDSLMEAASGELWASIPAFTKIVTPA